MVGSVGQRSHVHTRFWTALWMCVHHHCGVVRISGVRCSYVNIVTKLSSTRLLPVLVNG